MVQQLGNDPRKPLNAVSPGLVVVEKIGGGLGLAVNVFWLNDGSSKWKFKLKLLP